MPDHAGRSAIDDAPSTLQSAATTAGTGTELDVKGWANVALQVSGTYTTATTTFQITLDGTNWVSTEGVNTATGVSSASATANGIYLVNCAGAERFRANLTTIVGTSQTVVARGTPFDGSVAGLGAAGETVTANQGAAGATWPVAPQATTTGGTTLFQNISTGVTGVVIVAGVHQLYLLDCSNSDSAAVYVKVYDKATAPTQADTPLLTTLVPAAGGRVIPIAVGSVFTLGIAVRASGAAAVADTTTPTANTCHVSGAYK